MGLQRRQATTSLRLPSLSQDFGSLALEVHCDLDIDHRTGDVSRSVAVAARRWLRCFPQTINLIGSPLHINIADYEPLVTILDLFKPVLNKANPSAVIITELQKLV